MDRSIRLGLITGFIVTVVLIVVVYIFKPIPSPAHTAKTKEKTTSGIGATVEKKAGSVTPVQSEIASAPDRTALLEQRDQLYKEFAAISDALSHGQQPDLRQVNQMLEQQKQLVKTGTVAADEALSYCHFLKQILPAMDHQIDQHILQLEQLKRNAI